MESITMDSWDLKGDPRRPTFARNAFFLGRLMTLWLRELGSIKMSKHLFRKTAIASRLKFVFYLVFALWMNFCLFRGHSGAVAEACSYKRNAYGFDSHPEERNIYLNVYFHFGEIFGRVIQHTMPSKFGGKWGTECPNTKFPLPSL